MALADGVVLVTGGAGGLGEASVSNAVAEAGKLGTFRYAVVAHGGFGVAEKVAQRDGNPASLERTTSCGSPRRPSRGPGPDGDGRRGAVVLTSVAPGTMRTPIMERVGEEVLAKIPNPRRPGKPAEYAGLVEHILENPYLTGETIRLDGAQRFDPR
ncbi:hypothetical protein [Amycolatopsis sp.]|uniref:hypothetical protein n=1 Tax=Amycolatopsis sp. TaxID=37632 RepID=UPI002C912BAF|nr:hypothetical protein [Amycolatopsis sp.]HVV08220.1 hypothetical protein [Amycolatopsis sp.]